MSNVITAESLTQALRKTNDPTLGSVAYATAVMATIQRMDEYANAYAHAHETGNLEEAQGLAIAMSRAAISLTEHTRKLDDALAVELTIQRAEAA